LKSDKGRRSQKARRALT